MLTYFLPVYVAQLVRRAQRAGENQRDPAITELLDTLNDAGQLAGALVTIDAMGCQVDIAQKISDAKAHYVLALKGNLPTLEANVTAYFDTAPAEENVATTTVEKRTTAASRPAAIAPPPTSTGSPQSEATRVNRAFRRLPL